jgi:hypothetical protein
LWEKKGKFIQKQHVKCLLIISLTIFLESPLPKLKYIIKLNQDHLYRNIIISITQPAFFDKKKRILYRIRSFSFFDFELAGYSSLLPQKKHG